MRITGIAHASRRACWAAPSPSRRLRVRTRRRGTAAPVERASPGPSAPSPSSAQGRWACPWPSSSRRMAGRVIAVDVNEAVVAAINEGRAHVTEEPGLAERVAEAHAAGRLRATTDGAAAAAASDVVVLIVPVMLDDGAPAGLPPHGRRRGRDRPGPPVRRHRRVRDHAAGRATPGTAMSRASRRRAGSPSSRTCSSPSRPERLYSGAVFDNLATYPKLVGGVGPASTDRAARFYASVLDAEVVAMSSAEAAELRQARGDDVPRRQHRVRERARGVRGPDRRRRRRGRSGPRTASRTATSTSRGSAWAATASRSTRTSSSRGRRRWSSWRCRGGPTTGRWTAPIAAIERGAGRPPGRRRPRPRPHLSGGRPGARVLAGDAAHRGPRGRGCTRVGLGSPARAGTRSRAWARSPGRRHPGRDARVIVLQTADPAFRELDPDLFPDLELVLDGRNAFRDVEWPAARARPRVRHPRARCVHARRRRARPCPPSRRAAVMRTASIVGTRPQLIKAAALLPELRKRHDDVLIDTGQHWDERLAGDVLHGARAAASGSQPGHRRRRPRIADGADARRARAHPARRGTGRRDRVRRHELDPRGRARRGEAVDPGRPCRSRPAKLRPPDARGGQPRRRRPPRDVVLRPDPRRRGEPRP